MFKILLILSMVSSFAFASNGSGGETDIIQRTVNFILFAGLIWYFVSEPVKNYFISRSQEISDRLQSVQDKMEESVLLKKDAETKLKDAEVFVSDLKKSLKKEIKIISDKISKDGEAELLTLEKHNESLREFEQKSMIQEVVEDTIKALLENNSKSLDEEKIASIILKKVA